MKIDKSFSSRVSIARNALGLTQGQLADMVGIVRRQIAAYEAGDSKPRIGVLQNLAAALGTTTEWLATGKGSGPDVSGVKRTVTLREIPVLSHVQAKFETLEELLKTASVKDFIPAPPGANENCFAIQVEGDSMSSAHGISFPPGSIVTFDTSLPAYSGDFVLCHSPDCTDAMFKQLIVDQGNQYLKSLNSDYPMISSNSLEFIGVAIHSQIRIHKNDRDFPTVYEDAQRLISDRNNVSADSLSALAPSGIYYLDERLNRLEEISEKLEKIFSKQVVQQVLQESPYPPLSSMVEGKDKKK
ncbi:LexA family transcriptional regulator [Lonsdalea britannica]|uniref:LexA family protein n=1 Tax=Lonsdalea britannica TaxID=1082704 RepID=UPI0026F14164|nr:S24 family peptidase [Lonsdalea britannica]